MEITVGNKIMRDGKVILIRGKKEDSVPKIISDTVPKFVQDETGTWIKNPEWTEN